MNFSTSSMDSAIWQDGNAHSTSSYELFHILSPCLNVFSHLKSCIPCEFSTPQAVRKLFLTVRHSPLLYLNKPKNHLLTPLYYFLQVHIWCYPPLSKLTFEFSDGLPSNPKIRKNKQSILQMIYSLCTEEVSVDWQILTRAEEIRHISNIKYKDSIHLACAEAANVLLTTDKKFMKNCHRITTYTKVMNPNEWLMEVLY